MWFKNIGSEVILSASTLINKDYILCLTWLLLWKIIFGWLSPKHPLEKEQTLAIDRTGGRAGPQTREPYNRNELISRDLACPATLHSRESKNDHFQACCFLTTENK